MTVSRFRTILYIVVAIVSLAELADAITKKLWDVGAIAVESPKRSDELETSGPSSTAASRVDIRKKNPNLRQFAINFLFHAFAFAF